MPATSSTTSGTSARCPILKRIQKIERSAEKRAIEIARYVLPVAAFTAMVHTVSGIVLHRLWRMCSASDTPNEARAVIGDMVKLVRDIDPQFFDRFGTGPLEELPEWKPTRSASRSSERQRAGSKRFVREFDAQARAAAPHARRLLAERTSCPRRSLSCRSRRLESACPDAEAIDRLLNPARNIYRLETLNVGVHAPLDAPLQHANYTFAKKISHTADSQDQRHRMVPGSRPLLTLADTRDPDYITPMLLDDNPRAKEVYQRAMHDAWEAKNNSSIAASPPRSRSIFCPTPNPSASSNPARSSISSTNGPCAPASTPRKKSTSASMDEVAQLREVHPQLARYVGPPCHLRAGITTPICTEGSHFCGIKVWLDFPNAPRRI